ncbi:PASTA domain-containing protein [Bifidobacterium sp. ESL0825]|uniref:PASTA domain-containing protein n=1 Tax=Bifidobacterium sp. ESL0825 TaxID=3448587 RepID=UPI004042B436
MKTGIRARGIVAVIGALMMVLSLSACDTQKEVPDVTGKSFSEATATLSKEGFTYDAKDGTDRIAFDGTVTGQDPKGGTKTDDTKVKLTVKSSMDEFREKNEQQQKETAEKKAQQQNTPAPSAEKSTSGGLTQTYALLACRQRGKQEFPYGFKPHFITDAAEPIWSPDSVLLQFGATVKNEYNAKRDVIVNCNVRGSNDKPEVFGWTAQ